MNATEMFAAAQRAVRGGTTRTADDPQSPAPKEMQEAVGVTLTLDDVSWNVPEQRKLDFRWAAANVLHFFTGAEEAAALLRINRFAGRFLTGDRWVGAYGAVAVPQLRRCVEHLRKHPYSRRAVVSMGEAFPQCYNRPACISFMHLLRMGDALDMLVYSRSCNLFGVLPYDLVLLSNVLVWAATSLHVHTGSLRWTFGSLHAEIGAECVAVPQPGSLLLPVSLLDDPTACAAKLEVM